MKKYKNILIFIVALVLCGVLAVSGSAMLKTVDIDDYSHHGGYHNEKAAAYLRTVDLFENKVNLLYVDSQTNSFSGDVQDYYVDESDNEYVYNSNGTLNSISPTKETAEKIRAQVCEPTYGKGVALNEKQAKEFATELLQKLRKEDFDKFEYAFLDNYNKRYDIVYRQMYQNNYIGESVIIRFDEMGNLRLIAYKANGDLTNFDPTILDDISEKTLSSFVANDLQTTYPGYTYARYETLEKYVRKVDGKLGILLEVRGHFVRNKDNKSVTELTEVFYPFPDQAAAVKK